MYVDAISDDFVKKYKTRTPPWGPIGFPVYKRTYARKIENQGRTEEWWETVRRCCNGILAIGGKFTKEEIETLYDKVFNLKCCFSGRALWQLGTDTVKKLGGDSLVNCWAVPVDDPIKPFCFAFNELMLGGGVGFNIQQEYVYDLPRVKHSAKIIRKDEKDVDFIVPDNREGWVELLRRTLQSFFFTGKGFSYSTICVRSKGSAIQSFGGTASGPEELCNGIEHIATVLQARVGEKLRPIDCLDIMNIIGSIVVAGNVRRSAQVGLGDFNDFAYLDAKNWGKGSIPNWRAMSNNSVICNKFEHLPEKFWNGYNGEGEAYGLVNIKNCRTYGRLIDGKDYRLDKKVVACNPCITGDTLVYVADGRGAVPIQALAEEGMDVPVFCLDNKKNITVRTMRHPRMTGQKVPIMKITMEDGLVLRATPNHKFLTSAGTYKQVAQLTIGDGLKMATRYLASIKDIWPNANSNSQDYWWVNTGRASTYAEHRIIAEFTLGRKLHNEVVHHRDYNSQNNVPSNLEVMSKKGHDILHRQDKLGDKNPMRRAQTEWSNEKWAKYSENMSNSVSAEKNGRYCGQTNEDLRQHAIELCRQKGRRFSKKEWLAYAAANGLPQRFSKWRTAHLNGVNGLATWAAAQMGFDPVLQGAEGLDLRTVRLYKKLVDQGYDCRIENHAVVVTKQCEVCGKSFETNAWRTEQGLCSASCVSKRNWADKDLARKMGQNNQDHWMEHAREVRNQQLDVFTKLRFEIGRDPDKKEWQEACKNQGVSFEIARKSSPFRYWSDLKTAAASFNHRIVSIEIDGEADVYNGTVDEFHNFFVGGFESQTKNGKRKSLWCNNLQCGEVPLPPYSACNLFEIFLPNIKDEEEFKQVAVLGVKVTKTISCMNFIHEETNQIVHEEYRLGNSVTGILQASPELRNEKVFDHVYKHMEKVDKEYSKTLGVSPSVKLTTVKPSGTLSLLAGVTAGIHPAYAPCYIRRVRMASDDPLVETCRKNGYHVEPVQNFDGTFGLDTMVVSFPCKVPEGTVCAKNLSAIQQMEWAKWAQTHWSDNSVSVTIYYKKEELPDIKKWLSENYDKNVKTISFCLHSEHGFRQPPYEEISEDTYKQMKQKVKPITRLSHDEGMVLAESMECASGVCPVGGRT